MKKAFVMMPIKKVGSTEHQHYRALFDSVLKPVLHQFGYDTKRADDFQAAGSITRDIIKTISESEIVIADLTDLNPNVFYELGVRHTLRGSGTIMIMDETSTEIPFDISTYRVIKFRSDVAGIGKLRQHLESYIETITSNSQDFRDNPVHDWLPSLPMDLVESSNGSVEENLKIQLASLKSDLSEYKKKYGNVEAHESLEAPSTIIRQAIREAEEGALPALLVDEAILSAQEKNVPKFLELSLRAIELKSSRLSIRQVVNLMSAAESLDLASVKEALLDHAQALFPTRPEIRLMQLQTFAHSEDPARREHARREFASDLGMSEESDGTISFAKRLSELDIKSLSIMLDAYHRDSLNEMALKIGTAANESHPNNSILLRNLGRAHEKLGHEQLSLDLYTAAVFAPDSDDTAAVWLGSELHNRSRHVDAAEAYTLGCLRDPDDADIFIHLLDELSWCKRELESGIINSNRSLSKDLDLDSWIRGCIAAALSCGNISGEDAERFKSAAQRAEVSIDEIVETLRHEPNDLPTTRLQRTNFVKVMRREIGSSLTIRENNE